MQLGIYQHYKGNLYQVIGISRHSETLEELVVYQNLNNKLELWVRPVDMFKETLLIDGKEIPRFRYRGSSHTQVS